MADVCEKHNIKLLTYGTFVRIAFPALHILPLYRLPLFRHKTYVPSQQCGGFLADAWLDRPEPDPYSGALTPSQRKVSQVDPVWRLRLPLHSPRLFPTPYHHTVSGSSILGHPTSPHIHTTHNRAHPHGTASN
jgi:hypothetical protein